MRARAWKRRRRRSPHRRHQGRQKAPFCRVTPRPRRRTAERRLLRCLPVPLLPTSVVRTGTGSSGDPWVLFDGRASTAIETTSGEPARIEIALNASTKLAALSLLGPAEGTVSVY